MFSAVLPDWEVLLRCCLLRGKVKNEVSSNKIDEYLYAKALCLPTVTTSLRQCDRLVSKTVPNHEFARPDFK